MKKNPANWSQLLKEENSRFRVIATADAIVARKAVSAWNAIHAYGESLTGTTTKAMIEDTAINGNSRTATEPVIDSLQAISIPLRSLVLLLPEESQ